MDCIHAMFGKDSGPGLGHGHRIDIGRRLLRLDLLLDGCATVWMNPDGWECILLSVYMHI